MRWYRSPLAAPRPRERAQRLVHEARRGLARDLARERHARGHRGVGGDAIEGAQLIGAEAQDVVEAGVGGGGGEGGGGAWPPAPPPPRGARGPAANPPRRAPPGGD